jgi:hypothetical protein
LEGLVAILERLKSPQQKMEAQMDANLVAILERLESPQQKMEVNRDANQEIMEAKVATIMNAIQERMEATIKTSH